MTNGTVSERPSSFLPAVSGITSFFTAFFSFVFCVFGFILLFFMDFPVTILYDKFFQLAVTAIVFSSVFAVLLYVKSFTVDEAKLAPGGNTGKASLKENHIPSILVIIFTTLIRSLWPLELIFIVEPERFFVKFGSFCVICNSFFTTHGALLGKPYVHF